MSNTPSNQPAVMPTGTVVSVQDGQGQNDQGSWVRGKNVTFQLSSGPTGTVFVPDSQFNPDMVKAMVQDAAQRLAAVHNLTF